MKYLEYNVQNMNISKQPGDKTVLISGAVNYFGLHFNFDEEFSALAGAKICEFYKNRQTVKVDLVDDACAIPNDFLKDNKPFEIRIISGTMVGTPWAVVSITESGVILPDEPQEEPAEGTEYVKCLSGDEAVALLRAGENGLEYSQDGNEWKSGVSGVPEVPTTPTDSVYMRKNGDWVDASDLLMINAAVALETLDPAADLTTVIDKVIEIIEIMKNRGIVL